MSEPAIDLIYVEYQNASEMSCAVVGGGKDKLIGPVPSKNAVIALATLVLQHLPEMFADEKAAQDRLMFIHFRNISMRSNSAGMDYPFKIAAPKS